MAKKRCNLPISDEAKRYFLIHDQKQRLRFESDPQIRALWGERVDVVACLLEVPECEFWRIIRADMMLRKCCVEHRKLKNTFFYTMDVMEQYGLQFFLDSGSLLSAIRDGGDTLIPWETDIDLGFIGVDPSLVEGPFHEHAKKVQEAPHHLFRRCAVKESRNVSRNGMCRDAHYVYHAASVREAEVDSSRVEIWPFWPEPFDLVHPTRKKLTVSRRVVEPLSYGGACKLWGRSCYCPRDSVAYLNHEYGNESWRLPKTIHWGTNNVPTWRSLVKV